MPKKDVPQFFRLNVEVGDLDAATQFYTKLLEIEGRKQPGARAYQYHPGSRQARGL